MADPALNTDWFHDAGWGVFTHWCGGAESPAEYNARVDGFDVDLLVTWRSLDKLGMTAGETC